MTRWWAEWRWRRSCRYTPTWRKWMLRRQYRRAVAERGDRREGIATALYDYFNPENLNGDDVDMGDMRHAADSVIAFLARAGDGS